MTAVAELPAALNADAIATACEVLRAAVALPVEQYESNPALRPLRQAIGPLLARSLGRTYDGAGPQGKDKDAARKAHRRQANRHRQQAVAAERAAADRSALRAQRLARLAASAAEGDVPRIADGPATVPTPAIEDESDAGGAAWSLACCYACRTRFPATATHAFYGAAFCPACASLNFEKRTQTANLTGRGALVTGARVKIGFRVALKLLRAGATVVATSRFPADCARRFAAEPDADAWRDRLRCVGCDFRDLGAVEALCAAVPELLGCGLDVLVNNACQTVRRPPQYYAETVAREAKLRKAIGNASLPLLEGASEDIEVTEDVSLMRMWTAKAPTTSDPALRALLCVAPGDDVRNDAAFPRGLRDANADLGEQLDLRRANSWTSKLEDVSTPELAEVFAINALAPFVINSKLIPVLKDGASHERRRFVINVSAMEGKFYRQKQPTHPHTNMAKAALNMMTKTSAAALAEAFVYMTSVDTGWVNDEKPNHLAVDHASKHNFQTPIDEIDAASRILDPVFGAHEPPLHGVFLKDYEETEW